MHPGGALELLRDDTWTQSHYPFPTLGRLLAQRCLEPVFSARLAFLTGTSPGSWSHGSLRGLFCLPPCGSPWRGWSREGGGIPIIRPLDFSFSSPWRAPRCTSCAQGCSGLSLGPPSQLLHLALCPRRLGCGIAPGGCRHSGFPLSVTNGSSSRRWREGGMSGVGHLLHQIPPRISYPGWVPVPGHSSWLASCLR